MKSKVVALILSIFFGRTWNRQILSWLHRYRYFKINHLWGIRNLVAYRLNYDSNR